MAFKEGDWTCSECGDHQFARNVDCRRCGAPKRVVSSNQQVAKPGDWICPNPDCQDLQFERNFDCRRCGTPKPMHGGKNGGYYGCGSPRKGGGRGGYGPYHEAMAMYGPPPGSSRYGKGKDHSYGPSSRNNYGGDHCYASSRSTKNQSVKDGDWSCPACEDHQFARNSSCRNCGTPRPHEGGCNGGGKGGTAYRKGGEGYSDSYSMHDKTNMKEGDWICEQCGDHQFARNTSCRKCGAQRFNLHRGYSSPQGAYCDGPGGGYGKGAGHSYAYPPPPPIYAVAPGYAAKGGYGGDMSSGKGTGSGRSTGGSSGFQAGDWTCVECGDHQFARNEACRKCGAPKPVVSANRQTMKSGDWICPNPDCQDLQFAKNRTCRQCGMAKPDAQEEYAEEDLSGHCGECSRSPRR